MPQGLYSKSQIQLQQGYEIEEFIYLCNLESMDLDKPDRNSIEQLFLNQKLKALHLQQKPLKIYFQAAKAATSQRHHQRHLWTKPLISILKKRQTNTEEKHF